MGKKILFVGYRDNNHSKNGGYDNIAAFPGADYLRGEDLLFGNIPVRTRGKRLNLWVLDFVARRKSHKYDIEHYFYADSMLFLKMPLQSKCKFVATIHLDVKDLSDNQLKVLRSFDKVICLSTAEQMLLKDVGINATFVPHGFNSPEFSNTDIQGFDKDRINVFYSGMNYRDFDTFLKVIDFTTENRKEIHFHAVGQSKENKILLKEKRNVTVYPRLNDDEYYSLLSMCDYNFLPMTFATANNALLEAQSLGIVGILPRIDGVTDYADEDNNIFYGIGNSVEAVFLSIEKRGPDKRLFDYSKQFSWTSIYARLEKIYDSL